MNQELKAKWVAALRSGKYTQGQGYLHRVIDGQERFCCFGVACDLAWRDGEVERRDEGGVMFYEEGDCYPPPSMAELFLGEESFDNPDWTLYYENAFGDEYYVALDRLNDVYGLTFDQIADMIERWM